MNDPRRCAELLILALLSLGCGASAGGSDGGDTAPPPGCGMVDVCAGDLTGTWKVLGGCTDALYWDGLLTCPPNTPEQLLGLGYAGTVTFNSDMTYAASIVETGTAPRYTIPSACLPGGVTCTEVSPICSGGSTCTCLAAGAGASAITGSGTYSIGGSELTFYPAPNSSIGGVSYCVQGELLHLETDVTIIQSDGTRVSLVTSDIIAQKQ